jgi:hypothetical protein
MSKKIKRAKKSKLYKNGSRKVKGSGNKKVTLEDLEYSSENLIF